MLAACVGLVLALPSGPVARAQAPAGGAAPSRTLAVAGDVASPLALSAADMKALPRTRVEVKQESRTVVYEGVLVGELLRRAGAPVGGDLRGDALATYVLVSASDGYQAVFSIGELDPALTANEILVADTVDGQPLTDSQGPFRIVAPKDSRAVRSVRMLERLEVVRLRKGR